MKQTNPFYNTKKWKQKRKTILKRDEYQCRECRRYGKVTPADTVHHIYPLEYYPQYKLNSNNLISLCNTCHENMHNRLTGELTEKGIQWMGRMRDKIVS